MLRRTLCDDRSSHYHAIGTGCRVFDLDFFDVVHAVGSPRRGCIRIGWIEHVGKNRVAVRIDDLDIEIVDERLRPRLVACWKDVGVEPADDDAQRDGLDTLQVRTDVEVKLRQASISVLSEDPPLDIYVAELAMSAPGEIRELAVMTRPIIRSVAASRFATSPRAAPVAIV